MADITFKDNDRLFKLIDANREKILTLVNDKLQKENDLSSLIGKNDISVMFNNHKNHLDFILNVINLNDFSLLEKAIPWVYATYTNKGFSFDYFPVLFDAFIAAYCSLFDEKTAGSLSMIYDYLKDNHDLHVSTAAKTTDNETGANSYPGKTNEAFLSFLISGKYRDCVEMTKKSIKTKDDIVNFYIGTIQPCMYDVGRLWHENKISVAHEHLASSIISRVMAYIYTEYYQFEMTRGSGMISAVCNEYHEMGARMTADILDINGWNTKFLGSDTPVPELLKLLKEDKPDFLGLSVTMTFNLRHLSELLSRIKSDPGLGSIKIILGGLVFNQNPGLLSKFPHDGYAKDASECLRLLEGWWRGNGFTGK